MYQECHKKAMVHGQDEGARCKADASDPLQVLLLTSTTNGTNSQGTATQEANRPSWQCLQIHKSGTNYTHSYAQTNKHMYNWILLEICSLIDLFCN